jgi:glucose/arabinose dehydrogenase
VAGVYQEICGNCHGKNLEGGQAESLLDDRWKHGGDDASLLKTIRDGYETNGMPPFKNLLTEGEIRAMVVFIREKRSQAAQKQASFARPTGDQVVRSRLHPFRVKTVVEGLNTPWSIAFLPHDRILVTELPGRLRVVEKGRLLEQAVEGTPKVLAVGQGGLMEVAPHPAYRDNGWIYLAFSDPSPDAKQKDTGLTAIVRGRIREMKWVDEEVIFRAPYALYRPGGVHFGCRLVFDGRGHLFFSIGERGHMRDAQDLSRPNGKVHRIHDDGRIPADNPFVGASNAFPTLWSYGNRNPQGLDLHPVTGELWEVEHGPRGGDELNLILKGRNYGWPVITYGMNYDGTPITGLTAHEGMEQPIIHWTPSIAVCAMEFYRGDTFPQWKHHLFVTALAQQELRRVVIRDHQVLEQEVLFKDIGRVRDVVTGPDGLLYVALNKPDKIARLEPE